MNQLQNAIAALKLAKEGGGENDREQYALAFDGLVVLSDKILRYDQKLNADEKVPTGDDYNTIVCALGLTAIQQADQSSIGKLWWSADDVAEAKKWEAEYLAKGAISVELKPESDRSVVDVIITLDRNRATEILGHAVGKEEWLDISEDSDRPNDGSPIADGKTTLERKAAAADDAALFMQELLDSVETLLGIANEYGTRTLVDLMYLQAAILDGGFIDQWQEESSAMEIASGLPSGERWAKFIKIEHMTQRETATS